jgi:uncharacterized protein YndB with AHSA1/START domain
MSKPSYVYVTYIRAPMEKVWDAITDRELTQQYWAHWNVSDWKPGSRWDHQRSNGSDVIDITGTVIESMRPTRLVISWASPDSAAQPDKVSRVSFEIALHAGDVTRLTVTHSDLEAGSAMENGITRGWPIVLSSLKSWLETGQSLPLASECTRAA